MRIRRYREGDIDTLVELQREAAEVDGTEVVGEEGFRTWFDVPEVEARHNVFIVTDDDDDQNQWGQAETLEGLEGIVAGYTILQLHRGEKAYHFICEGTVGPIFRGQHAGWALLVSALNRAQIWAAEFEYEAEGQGIEIYFEALLPERDRLAPFLARRCEMEPVEEAAPSGLQLYRKRL